MSVYRPYSLGERLCKIVAGGFFIWLGVEYYPQEAEAGLILSAIGIALGISSFFKFEKVF